MIKEHSNGSLETLTRWRLIDFKAYDLKAQQVVPSEQGITSYIQTIVIIQYIIETLSSCTLNLFPINRSIFGSVH